MHDGKKSTDRFEKILSEFSMPDRKYAPYLFWFFDQDLETLGIKPQEMAHELAKKGFNPGYAHARANTAYDPNYEQAHVHPLPLEQWLSDKWFDVMQTQLLQAQTDGVHFSFTDDFGWPSMQAGGRLVEADPSLKAKSLWYSYTDLEEGETIDTDGCFFAVVGTLKAVEQSSYISYEQPDGEFDGDIWRNAVIETPYISYEKPEDIPAAWRWNHFYCDQTPPEKNDTLPFHMAAAFSGDRRCTATYHFNLPANGNYKVYACWQDVGSNTSRAVYEVAGITVERDQRIGAFIWNLLGEFSLKSGMNTVTVRNAADGILSVDAVKLVSEDGVEIIVDDLEKFGRLIGYLDVKSLRVLEDGPFTASEKCRVYRFTLGEHRGLDYASIDYLQDRVSDLFIQACWEPYFQKMGDFMGSGKTLNGIFADHEGDYGYKLAWSESLSVFFRERYSEDIRRILPLLIDRDTDGTDAVWRFRWFDTVSEIYARHFKKLSQKAAEHDLYYTFHAWEESLPLQAFCVGDPFKLNRALSLPGTDALHNVCFNPQNFKDFFSVAEFEGLRLMDEVSALTALRDYTPELLKKQANYLAAYGVSHVINHAVKMTRPRAQTVVPPDFYNIDPCWNAMEQYTGFLRRISYINSLGNARAEVLLLNPLDSMYVLAEHEVFTMDPEHFCGQPQVCSIFGGEAGEINRQYGQIIRILTRRQIEFLTADKEYMRRMELNDGTLCYKGYKFNTVILPRSHAIDLNVAEKLYDFVSAGGKLWVIGHFPTVSLQNGRDDPTLRAIWEKSERLPNVNLATEPEQVRLTADIRFSGNGNQLLCHWRIIDGRHFIYLCNNQDTDVKTEITLPGIHGSTFLLHPDSGETSTAASTDKADGLCVKLSLISLDAVYLVVDPAITKQQIDSAIVLRTVIPDRFRASIDRGPNETAPYLSFDPVKTDRLRLILRKGGFDDPTHPDVQHIEIFCGDRMVAERKIDRSFTVEYDDVQAVTVELECQTVDGIRITTQRGLTSYRLETWDGIWWKTVGESDRYGQNECINAFPYPTETYDVALTDWSEWNFLPERFAGIVTYETDVTLTDADITGSAILKLGRFCGSVAVSVNGTPVGQKMFVPFTFEIGGALRPGLNRISLAVSNTIYSNLSETHGGISSVSIDICSENEQ